MKRKFANIVILAVIAALGFGFASCGDDISYDSISGTWYGTRTYVNPVSGRKYVYLTVEFGDNKTGLLEYQTPTSIGEAVFEYSISRKEIKCNGVYANSDGDVEDRFFNFKIDGDRLNTESFGGFILTKDGSVITDSDGNEFTGENRNVDMPSFDKYLTTSDYDGFTIMLRFKNGGDKYENMECELYWRAYAKKPTTPPTEEDMTNTEDMDIYDHNNQKTTFDCSHRGFNGGTYIYYYAVCSNSKGSCKTGLTYEIIPRL